MFAEISKSFAQSFLVGHLLPAILFVAFAKFVVGYSESQGLIVFFEHLSKAENLADLGIFGVILGLLLSTINRELIRFFEGYGALNPFRLLFLIPHARVNERLRFQRLDSRIDELSDQAENPQAGKETLFDLGALQVRFAGEFPESERLVLPTRFGNTIRAFERYSDVAYNFEAIEGTNRLSPFVEEAMRSEISWVKSKVDFWVNISVLLVASAILWAAIVRAPVACTVPIALPIGLAAAYVPIILARHAAFEWGVNVKASIDLALPKLAETLGYEIPIEAEKQQQFWRLLSQHFLLRDATTLHDLQVFRKKPGDDGKATPKAAPKRFVPQRIRRQRLRRP
jgi:hypothetical protein